MFFSVQELEVRSKEFDVAYRPGEIDFSGENLRQVGPLAASGKVELLNHTLGEIRVRGHLAVRLDGECDRCLEPAEFAVDSDFDLFYRPAETGPAAEERAIDAGEAELAFYDGDGLELKAILGEFVLLSLPMQRVCRQDCRGICPICGRNRNQAVCDCHLKLVDDRWAALRALR